MAIIYSYPKQTVLQNTDLLIGTRFSTEPGIVPRSISFSIETLTEYINASAPIPTLDQVLNEGNVSLLDAQVGGIYLYDDFTVPGYLSIRGFKDRVYFYSKSNKSYGYITQNSLVLKDELSDYHFTIKKANSIESNHAATFQNTSGTVAYLDDLLTLNLDQVLDNGNSSLQSAYIGTLGLWDNFNEAYSFVNSNRNRLNFTNSNGFLVGYLAEDTLLLNDSDSAFNLQIKKPSVITANRIATFQNASGTVAYLSDVPTVPASNNYGLFAQTGNSTPISGTTTETTLINGGVGTLTVPANGFQIGDSFRAVFGGVINAANNQTIRIRVKAGSVVLLDSGIQSLTNSIVNDVWSLNIDFTVRQLGAPGVASIVSLGSFHYIKTSNASTQGFAFNVVNNTTFNTTISNTLDVTVQWGSTNAGNSIYSDIFVLNKTY